MTELPAPLRRYPYAPFLLGSYAGALASVAVVKVLVGAATLLRAPALGGYILPVALALNVGGGLAACYLATDRLLKYRGLASLTWPQRWGGLWRGALLVLLGLPVLVFVAGAIGVPLVDARSTGLTEAYVDGESRRGAVLGLTVALGFLTAPPVFAYGLWRCSSSDRR